MTAAVWASWEPGHSETGSGTRGHGRGTGGRVRRRRPAPRRREARSQGARRAVTRRRPRRRRQSRVRCSAPSPGSQTQRLPARARGYRGSSPSGDRQSRRPSMRRLTPTTPWGAPWPWCTPWRRRTRPCWAAPGGPCPPRPPCPRPPAWCHQIRPSGGSSSTVWCRARTTTWTPSTGWWRTTRCRLRRATPRYCQTARWPLCSTGCRRYFRYTHSSE